jgi:hypothetical protein
MSNDSGALRESIVKWVCALRVVFFMSISDNYSSGLFHLAIWNTIYHNKLLQMFSSDYMANGREPNKPPGTWCQDGGTTWEFKHDCDGDGYADWTCEDSFHSFEIVSSIPLRSLDGVGYADWTCENWFLRDSEGDGYADEG